MSEQSTSEQDFWQEMFDMTGGKTGEEIYRLSLDFKKKGLLQESITKGLGANDLAISEELENMALRKGAIEILEQPPGSVDPAIRQRVEEFIERTKGVVREGAWHRPSPEEPRAVLVKGGRIIKP